MPLVPLVAVADVIREIATESFGSWLWKGMQRLDKTRIGCLWRLRVTRSAYSSLSWRRSGCLFSLLDASDADVIREITTKGLARSDVLVSLQTKMVLTRPWVLMELLRAMRRRIPIMTLRIEGRGCDYFVEAASDAQCLQFALMEKIGLPVFFSGRIRCRWYT